MKVLFCLIALFSGSRVWSQSLDLIGTVLLKHDMKFKKTKIGGLSGIWFDESTSELWAVSDDRGRVNEPRIYKFKVSVKPKFKIEPVDVFFIKGKDKPKVLDMEGLAVLPWGNLLVSSEGDQNQKPRERPRLMDIKKDGSYIRDYEIPDAFLPELTGEQKVGIHHNKALEGLTTLAGSQKVWAWTEDVLVQDVAEEKPKCNRVVQYEMPDAWVIKPTKQFCYQPEKKTVPNGVFVGYYVSEALALTEKTFLVMERGLVLKPSGVEFAVQVFVADLSAATEIQDLKTVHAAKPMAKKAVLDFEKIKDKLGGPIENFEGLSFGPKIDGERTVIVVSDNNFKKDERTQFLLFKLKDTSP